MRTILILMALTLLVSACSTSDVSAPSEDASETAPDEAPESPATPEAPDEPSEPAELKDEFESLFSGGSSWTVTYEATTTAGSETMESTMTQYVDGENRFRTDSTTQGFESRMYLVDGVVTVCTQQDDWMCFESDLSDEISAQADVEESIESGDYNLLESERRTIAGAEARCFTFETEVARSEYCLSEEGVPLLISVDTEAVTTEMIATEYNTGVPADAWDVPAEAGSFPGMDDLPGGFDPSAYT